MEKNLDTKKRRKYLPFRVSDPLRSWWRAFSLQLTALSQRLATMPNGGATLRHLLPGGRLCAARQVASYKVGAPEGGSISCARDRSLSDRPTMAKARRLRGDARPTSAPWTASTK